MARINEMTLPVQEQPATMNKRRPPQVEEEPLDDKLLSLDNFGKRLHVLRLDRQLTQKDLRDRMEKQCRVKVGVTYISELERNTRRPSLHVIAALAKVLDVSMDYLGMLIDEPESYRRQPARTVFFSEEAEEIAEVADNLPPAHRMFLLSTAKNLTHLSNRRLEKREILDTLDSIERAVGPATRAELERTLRRAGVPLASSNL